MKQLLGIVGLVCAVIHGASADEVKKPQPSSAGATKGIVTSPFPVPSRPPSLSEPVMIAPKSGFGTAPAPQSSSPHDEGGAGSRSGVHRQSEGKGA